MQLKFGVLHRLPPRKSDTLCSANHSEEGILSYLICREPKENCIYINITLKLRHIRDINILIPAHSLILFAI